MSHRPQAPHRRRRRTYTPERPNTNEKLIDVSDPLIRTNLRLGVLASSQEPIIKLSYPSICSVEFLVSFLCRRPLAGLLDFQFGPAENNRNHQSSFRKNSQSSIVISQNHGKKSENILKKLKNQKKTEMCGQVLALF